MEKSNASFDKPYTKNEKAKFLLSALPLVVQGVRVAMGEDLYGVAFSSVKSFWKQKDTLLGDFVNFSEPSTKLDLTVHALRGSMVRTDLAVDNVRCVQVVGNFLFMAEVLEKYLLEIVDYSDALKNE